MKKLNLISSAALILTFMSWLLAITPWENSCTIARMNIDIIQWEKGTCKTPLALIGNTNATPGAAAGCIIILYILSIKDTVISAIPAKPTTIPM